MDDVARTAGNEMLTSAAAVLLTVLLAAEELTLLQHDSLLPAHMFIGLVVVPPVTLKLASSANYREKGPPQILLLGSLAAGVGLAAAPLETINAFRGRRFG